MYSTRTTVLLLTALQEQVAKINRGCILFGAFACCFGRGRTAHRRGTHITLGYITTLLLRQGGWCTGDLNQKELSREPERAFTAFVPLSVLGIHLVLGNIVLFSIYSAARECPYRVKHVVSWFANLKARQCKEVKSGYG